jgi:CheY-like chemotaxis protein
MVVGDSNRLQQMVWNLLSNAIKFTPEGGEVEVRLERVGSHAQIRVTDTGIGIRADFLPYVFDRFSQADSSTTRKFGGLGMGLAMVRHLVELHGGTVRVESSGEGQGATFTVKLPLVTERIEGSSSKQSAPMVKDGLTLGDNCLLDGLRVLVVDDEPDVCELLAVVFDRYGAEVTAVTSAAEALEAIKQSIPDLLVSDIGMPDEDGYALMRKVRSLELELEGRVSAFNEAIPLAKRQEVQAIALTAYASEEDRQKAVEAGFQMHVSKPVEPDVLVAVVAQLTGRTFFEELSG